MDGLNALHEMDRASGGFSLYGIFMFAVVVFSFMTICDFLEPLDSAGVPPVVMNLIKLGVFLGLMYIAPWENLPKKLDPGGNWAGLMMFMLCIIGIGKRMNRDD